MEWLEGEQRVREVLLRLPRRCRELIGLLFYADPAMPYRDVAKRLGLPAGSISFVRDRCLRKLQKLLESAGLV